MKISYENDPARGPGHGLLRCAEERFPEGPCALALERGSDHLFLGRSGWGGQKVFLTPEGQRLEGETLVLLVGPAIVNQLDAQERYQVYVRPEEGGATCKGRLGVQGVVYSQDGPLGNAAMPTEAPEPPPEPAPAPPPEPEAVVETEAADPVIAPETAESDAPEPGAMRPNPYAGAAAMPGADEPSVFARPGEEKKGRGGLIALIVGLLLLLALGGGAAWYFLVYKKTPVTPEPPPIESPAAPEQADTPPAAPEPAPPEPPPAPEPAAAPEPPAPPQPTLSAEERVRAFFSGSDRSAGAAARLSRELPRETPADQDAVYRLWYFAGEQGEPGVLMDYAACLDPTRPQWGSIAKDARAAWDIYEKAKADDPAAAEAQQNLRAWLEQQAASGSEEARDWLRGLPR